MEDTRNVMEWNYVVNVEIYVTDSKQSLEFITQDFSFNGKILHDNYFITDIINF